jgi:hypothetical protein
MNHQSDETSTWLVVRLKKQPSTFSKVLFSHKSIVFSATTKKMMLASLRKLFKSHGEFCASQPWEVIVATITFLVCVLTVLNRNFTHLLPYHLVPML